MEVKQWGREGSSDAHAADAGAAGGAQSSHSSKPGHPHNLSKEEGCSSCTGRSHRAGHGQEVLRHSLRLQPLWEQRNHQSFWVKFELPAWVNDVEPATQQQADAPLWNVSESYGVCGWPTSAAHGKRESRQEQGWVLVACDPGNGIQQACGCRSKPQVTGHGSQARGHYGLAVLRMQELTLCAGYGQGEGQVLQPIHCPRFTRPSSEEDMLLQSHIDGGCLSCFYASSHAMHGSTQGCVSVES